MQERSYYNGDTDKFASNEDTCNRNDYIQMDIGVMNEDIYMVQYQPDTPEL